MMTAGDDLLCTSRGDVCSRIEKLRLLRFQEPSKRPLNHGCETPHRRRSVLRPPSLTASDRVCLGPAVKKSRLPLLRNSEDAVIFANLNLPRSARNCRRPPSNVDLRRRRTPPLKPRRSPFKNTNSATSSFSFLRMCTVARECDSE